MKKLLHAIVFAWPGQGHLNPLLRFSELLAKNEACRVTFVHSQQNLSRVRKAAAAGGSSASEVEEKGPQGQQLKLVGIDDGLAEGQAWDLPSLIVATDAQRHGGLVAAFDSLVAHLLEEDSSSCTFIVADFFMTFTQDVANKYGLPRVAVFVQSATSFACHTAVAQGFRPLPGAKYLNCLPEVLPSTTRVPEMISFLQNYDPSDPLFDYMLRSFKRLSEPAWIVLNSFDELEHEAIDYLRKSSDNNIKHLDCCGPLLPASFLASVHGSNDYASESMWEEDHGCLKWLDDQTPSSVLFVSFGSLMTLSARQAEELASGLEDSNVPFLWVIREGLIEDGDLPDGFVERVKESACLVSWAPQMKVLMHSSVGGFLTHGGWNSVAESVGAGVPLLGWPLFADQMLNCRCFVDSWGIGSSFFGNEDHNEEGLIPRDLIKTKIRALMLELPPSVKRNCASLREGASRAVQARLSFINSVLGSLTEGSMAL